MNKLEWCRANAPDSLKELDDYTLLEFMEEAWRDHAQEEQIVADNTELNPINKDMDYMVLELVRQFGNSVVFKGGYMLTKLMPECARQTTDIDFSIQSSELYQELISAMRAIGDKFVADGVISRYVIKDVIERRMSGGMDMYAADGSKVLGIDVGWHDVTFGTAKTSIDIGEVTAFTVERMLADKITAILSRKRFRRPKDLYDFYCLVSTFSFDTDLVNDFILKRTEGVGADWDNYPFSEVVLREYSKAYKSLRLDSIVTNKPLERPDFDEVMYRFNIICRRLHYDNSGGRFWDNASKTFTFVQQQP